MPIQYVFARKEVKYRLSGEQGARMLDRIAPFVMPDVYSDYTICNLYCDTSDFYFAYHSLEKPIYKEKLRLRSYGAAGPDETVFLELKKKYDGVVYKRRIMLLQNEALCYFQNGAPPSCSGQIWQELDYFQKRFQTAPRVFLAYDRKAFVAKDDPNLRITFDRNIRSRRDRLDFASGLDGTPLFSDETRILEIKSLHGLPRWLLEALAKEQLVPTSFSKYGTVYQAQLFSFEEERLCSPVCFKPQQVLSAPQML